MAIMAIKTNRRASTRRAKEKLTLRFALLAKPRRNSNKEVLFFLLLQTETNNFVEAGK